MKAKIAILAAMMISGQAAAADLDRGEQTPDYYSPNTPNWSGLYIGGRIGYGNANHDLTVERYNGGYCLEDVSLPSDFDPTDDADIIPNNDTAFNFSSWSIVRNIPTAGCADGKETLVDPSSRDIANLNGLNSHGFIGGFQAGADYQMGRFVLGVFGSYDWSNMKSSGFLGNEDLASFEIEKDHQWTVGGRAGVLASPRTLIYLLAGYTQTDYNFKGTLDGDSASKDVTFDGVSVGGGIEYALTNNIFIGLEYAHTFYGEETLHDTGGTPVGGFGHKLVDNLDEDTVWATLKAKTNGTLPSLD